MKNTVVDYVCGIAGHEFNPAITTSGVTVKRGILADAI
jgi:hypothetical protein